MNFQSYVTVALVVLAGARAHAQASNFKLTTRSSHPEVKLALLNVDNKLPAALKKKINRPIEIKFVKLDKLGAIYFPCDKKVSRDKHVLAEVDSLFTYMSPIREIRVNENFVAALKIESHHCGMTTREYFERTLIHELAHIYDFNGPLDGLEAEGFAKLCGTGAESPQQAPFCKSAFRKGKFSESAAFLTLDNWSSPTSAKNQDLGHAADAYERTHVYESFAIHFENYILDSEFACRKPAVHGYFKALFQEQHRSGCEEANKQVFVKNGFKSLDLSRLYQVHYLLADKGTELSSKFGHTMLRLVFCSPSRSRVDENCLNDISEHVVLSFRAHVDGMGLDNLKGLTGKYPSRLYTLSMTDVITEYTQGELRNLRSIPLNLNSAQEERLLQKTLEMYWAYRGKYYFISNNCATETAQLLASVAKPGDLRFQKYLMQTPVISPIGLLEYLVTEKMATLPKISIREQRKRGLLFTSFQESLNAAYKSLTLDKNSPYRKFSLGFLIGSSKAEQRRQLFEEALVANPQRSRLIGAAAYLIETQILEKNQRQMKNLIFEHRLKFGYLIEKAEAMFAGSLEETLHKQSFGYGIPLKSDFEQYVRHAGDAKPIDLSAAAHASASRIFPAQMKGIDRNLSNKNLFLKSINSVN